jgi:hypothetical protein
LQSTSLTFLFRFSRPGDEWVTKVVQSAVKFSSRGRSPGRGRIRLLSLRTCQQGRGEEALWCAGKQDRCCRDPRSSYPNPSIRTGGTGWDAWRRPLRPIRFHPEGAARRGEAPPRPYLIVATRTLSKD